jgi:hypothetical protein
MSVFNFKYRRMKNSSAARSEWGNGRMGEREKGRRGEREKGRKGEGEKGRRGDEGT